MNLFDSLKLLFQITFYIHKTPYYNIQYFILHAYFDVPVN